MLIIELVSLGNRLVGRTVSDRWNLMILGVGAIAYERNQGAVKRLRRALQGEGFTISVVRGGQVVMQSSPSECVAFDGAVPTYLHAA